MDARFFTADFDPVHHVLNEIPVDHKDNYLENKLFILDTIKGVVDKRLSDQVVKNYELFLQGMQHVHDIKMDITMTGIHCRNGRKQLARAENDTVRGILSVLAKQRKRARMMVSVNSMLPACVCQTSRGSEMQIWGKGQSYGSKFSSVWL